MKLVIIFGPQAVGKMTVGQELERKTKLKLFHNHMTIELVSNFFSYESKSGKRLVGLFREEIFKEVAASDLDGLIFTYVWGLDIPAKWDYIKKVTTIFEEKGGYVYLVELEADVEVRLERNKTENRLLHKPTKKNLEQSERDLLKTMENHRLNSLPGEFEEKNYMKINNTILTPKTVAQMIIERFEI
ncbi:AAA family ATPase [Paenibacillus sp. N1-5-1-14]|uniref:AAA family ATPase n=1 Tax=Paenibacillus radicibacter TaxID=2972488 RepID=UPI002158D968|nr:AAA family ATPase [Paenibacillus radicibacter]MCR8645517.1 AAA family ATPase [Paenibacillus radicibacter]